MRAAAERVFLDANVLSSAAIGSATCRAVCILPGVVIITSDYCVDEARRNLLAKFDGSAVDVLVGLLDGLETVPTPPESVWGSAIAALPSSAASDVPVLAAAMAARADTLVTGNTRDFGELMIHPVPGIPLALTPRQLLLRGPRRPA
ncbi:MAG: DNA-binding protein [Candidatus Nanopelagicales bacterium]